MSVNSSVLIHRPKNVEFKIIITEVENVPWFEIVVSLDSIQRFDTTIFTNSKGEAILLLDQLLYAVKVARKELQ